jgi:spectinomycin phosphotransferase/16S rRNA (guanine(1405)-N(7))-methyltransferase
MLNPPDGLRPDMLAEALCAGWGLDITSAEYLPLGFGSHHWAVAEVSGGRWFVTADELAIKRRSQAESLDTAFGRLSASLATATDLSSLGMAFVVAPVATMAGEPLVRLASRYTVALYPFLDGQRFEWGDFETEEHRQVVLSFVVAMHTAPEAARRQAVTDDLGIAHRDELDAVLDAAADADSGPYGHKTVELITAHEVPIRRLLARYDALVTQVRSGSTPTVLTHGEPHRANTMRTSAGWKLIDWDTVAVAPPERDLCNLDPGDGSVFASYQQATGITPRPTALELFRLRWDLADIAITVSQFLAPHSGDANDGESFELLGALLAKISR